MSELLIDILNQTTSDRLMVLLNMFLLVVVGGIASYAFKYFLKVYKMDQLKVDMLMAKSIEHDKEHIQIYNRLAEMLQEMKTNREHDTMQADTTRKLVEFMAKKAKIQIPDL